MEYKIVYGGSPSELTRVVNENLKEGWKLVGSHQVVVRHLQNRFRGTQHVDTLNDLEYTQTLVRES
jgi:hypothetical protein